jgi:chromosome segregation ATPase
VALPPTKVADVGRPAAPVNPVADDRAKAVEQLAKRLEAAEARVAVLERENDKLRAQAASLDRDNTALRTQVGTLTQEAAQAAQAHRACEARAAAQQKLIDGLKAEAAKLQGQVLALEAQLKARPPIDSAPARPKVGLPPPDLKAPVDPNKKKP